MRQPAAIYSSVKQQGGNFVKSYDAVIIGGGLLGCFAARALCEYRISAALFEAEEDVCKGISRANTAVVYPGYDTAPGTIKTRLCVSGCRSFDRLCSELGVDFNRCGSVMTAFGPRGLEVLRRKYKRGIENGVSGMSMLSGKDTLALEPSLHKSAAGGLFCSQAGTVIPWELGIAAFENARLNGVNFHLGERVLKITSLGTKYIIETYRDTYEVGMVINCAGLFADEIREHIFPPAVRIIPSKGDYLVFDVESSGSPAHIIFCEPEEKGKGLTLVPTTTGNLLAGPSDESVESKTDFSTTPAGLSFVRDSIFKYFPGLATDGVIRSFSALRPNPYHVVWGESGKYTPEKRSISNFTIMKDAPNFISFVGIKTPGLTCAFGLGRLAAEYAADFLSAPKNPEFNPIRPHPLVLSRLSKEERSRIVRQRPEFGRIICRCREISEGEIVDAVRRGAVTVDGVKRRTHALSGRCQGSFCTQRIMEILSRELNVPIGQITKDGGKSYIAGEPHD